MKVYQLILELQKLPQDLEVKVDRFMDNGGPEIFEDIDRVMEYHDRYYTCSKVDYVLLKLD